MADLPINKSDYDKAVKTTHLMNEIKKRIEASDKIKNYKFIPLVGGYEIKIETEKMLFEVTVKNSASPLSSKAKVTVKKTVFDDKLEGVKFSFKDEAEIEPIIDSIFEDLQ